VAFPYATTETSDIYVVNSDGTNLTNLTKTKATEELDLAFSPDGDQITFVRSTAVAITPEVHDVYVMDSDGSNQHRLTNDAVLEVGPEFSSDGERIILIRLTDAGFSGIYVMDADGSNMKRLMGNVFVGNVYPPSNYTTSPDGEKIAVDKFAFEPTRSMSSQTSNIELYAVNVDGTGLARLTRNKAYDGEPAFIPDTDKVAFVSDRDGDEDIYAMRLDGTDLTNLTDTDSADEAAPAFSADGTKMAYFSARRDRSGNLIGEIYVATLDGTD
jgi:TolB protein